VEGNVSFYANNISFYVRTLASVDLGVLKQFLVDIGRMDIYSNSERKELLTVLPAKLSLWE
jgi:hypothetical protein